MEDGVEGQGLSLPEKNDNSKGKNVVRGSCPPRLDRRVSLVQGWHDPEGSHYRNETVYEMSPVASPTEGSYGKCSARL